MNRMLLNTLGVCACLFLVTAAQTAVTLGQTSRRMTKVLIPQLEQTTSLLAMTETEIKSANMDRHIPDFRL